VLVSTLTKAKVLVWWAGTRRSEERRGPLTMALRKLLFRAVDGFLAYSGESAKYLREYFGIAGSTIVVLGNNTLDVAKYGEDVWMARQKRKQKAEAFTVLVVAELNRRKNIHTAIEAFHRLTEIYKGGAAMLIVGKGPEEEQLKRECAARGLRAVTFLGDLSPEAVRNAYQRSDVVLSIALVDQSPQVVNEAMACGLPVIISSTSGVDVDVVLDSVNGFVVEPRDVTAIARHLKSLAENREWCAQLGDASRRIAARNDLSSVLRKLSGVVDLGGLSEKQDWR
jgi:glycosyltransferase involved in cell wall biosynthesis